MCEGKALKHGDLALMFSQAKSNALSLFHNRLRDYQFSNFELIEKERFESIEKKRNAVKDRFDLEKKRYVENNDRNKVQIGY